MNEHKFLVTGLVEQVKPATTKTQQTNQSWLVTTATRELVKLRIVRGKLNGKKFK
jgi:hypothetical protein